MYIKSFFLYKNYPPLFPMFFCYFFADIKNKNYKIYFLMFTKEITFLLENGMQTSLVEIRLRPQIYSILFPQFLITPQ